MTKTAFIFPGQGSQSVGMLNLLGEEQSLVKQSYDEASEVLGMNLWQLVSEGPESDLNKTENTQPALLTAGVAIWRVWMKLGGEHPSLMAGHSLGEYTALVCSGALKFTDAVNLVAARGRFMQQAVGQGQGAMAAILGLDNETVIQVCTDVAKDQVVSAVNFNSPGQVVIAGDTAAVNRAVEKLKSIGAKRAVLLPVSVPSHCKLMKPAADQLAEMMQHINFKTPSIPVIQNASVTQEINTDMIRQRLYEQLFSPVHWAETIEAMTESDVERFIEAGPGKILTGLMRRINRKVEAHALFDMAGFKKLLGETK